MKLTFYGGVREVTGANYLLETETTKVLVDCGLKQGGHFLQASNWRPFPYKPADIDAIFITHSHIDHIGRLPKLYKDGFRGRVFSTAPCRDFSELLLYDSGHILAQEAERSGKNLLYDSSDIDGIMKLWDGGGYYYPVKVGDLTATFYNAGHILGSSFILVKGPKGAQIVFSGDLGNNPAPIIGDKDKLPKTGYCLIESTYGGRIHENTQERREVIEDVIEETVGMGGVLMIPAFAMERTQELLFEINELIRNNKIPKVKVFLDSPLAIKLTNVYSNYRDYFSKEAIAAIKANRPLIEFPNLKKTLKTRDSVAINSVPPPKIIIAGAGMMNGGRILYHLQRYLPNPKNELFIVGYQAKGSLGRKILDGAKVVKIHGERVSVRARIKAIGAYSAHADQPQLLNWLSPRKKILKKVFVVQGEENEGLALTQKIKDNLLIRAIIPIEGRAYDII